MAYYQIFLNFGMERLIVFVMRSKINIFLSMIIKHKVHSILNTTCHNLYLIPYQPETPKHIPKNQRLEGKYRSRVDTACATDSDMSCVIFHIFVNLLQVCVPCRGISLGMLNRVCNSVDDNYRV